MSFSAISRARRWWIPCLIVALASPTFAASAEKVGPNKVRMQTEAESEEIIRELYANLLSYTQTSDTDLRIETSDYVHIDKDEFDTRLWLDLVSAPDGLLVDMQRSLVRRGDALGTFTKFKPSLKFVQMKPGGDWDRMGGATLEEILAQVAASDEESAFADAVALTSFRVDVFMGPHHRAYYAAVAWTRPFHQKTTKLTLAVIDFVTQGVEEAAREPFPPLTREILDRPPMTSQDGRSLLKSDRCEPRVIVNKRSKMNPPNYDDHITGFHQVSGDLQVACICDEFCTNSCESTVVSYNCDESGGIVADSCHKMASSIATDSKSTSWSGTGTPGPVCGVAVGCSVKNCLFCLCSFGVEVEIEYEGSATIKVKLISSSEALWEESVDHVYACPSCELKASDPTSGGGLGDPDPISPDGGLDGGGSGGSGDGGDGGDSGGDGGGSGGDGGGGGSDGFDVYCDGEYAGVATSIEAALELCIAPDPGPAPTDDPDLPPPVLVECPPICA